MENVSIFVSQKAYYTFTGYAHSQRHKLSTKEPIGSRKELVDKYSYDVKFGYNLIRLYYESIELLRDGRMTLPHVQRKRLVDIKTGKVPLAEVLEEADRLKILTDEVWAKTKLPHSADINAVNELQKSMLIDFWKETGQL
jgi:hypothetical protein